MKSDSLQKADLPDETVKSLAAALVAEGVAKEPPAEFDHLRNCPMLNPMSDEHCICALRERIALQTEREMHNAWRKRAEEAELELLRLKAPGGFVVGK